MQELEELPEENFQQEEATPSTDNTDITIRNLKQLCLICGEFRDEKEELYNSDQSLVKEIETVYRYVCLFSETVQIFTDFWPRRLCVRHRRWRLQCVAGHCNYHRSVFFFFFSVFCF